MTAPRPSDPLGAIFPWLRTHRIPLSRDQAMLLLVAFSLIMTGVDTFLAHDANGNMVAREWIPVGFGFVAGAILLLAGAIARRRRTLASMLATLTLLASIGVGILGSYYHLEYGLLPTAEVGERVSLSLLVWAPPVLGPSMFAVIGVLGISAAWIETPSGSGRLLLSPGRYLQLPYSKSRAYYFIVSMGALATLLSCALDHARLGYQDPWLLVPIAAGVFATAAAATLGALEAPTRADYVWYLVAMVALLLVGPLGALLHVMAGLVFGGEIVLERVLRGAPAMAPLLFSDVGLLGVIALMDPREEMPSTVE